MSLNTALSQISGIGPTFARRLEKLNLYTVEDLIYHFPTRYDDFSKITKIKDLKAGERVTLIGEVWDIKNIYGRFGKVITKAILNDGSGSLDLVWFHQAYLTKVIKVGDKLSVAGEVGRFGNRLTVAVPDWEKDQRSLHTARLVPIYPETALLSSKWLRNQIDKILPHALEEVIDFLPLNIKDKMLPLSEALSKIHFPKKIEEAEKAKERLGFDELFLIQLATLQIRKKWQQKSTVKPWQIKQVDLEKFLNCLPFELTGAQKRVLSEIVIDLKKPQPMNRLLQGEVGSGKTVVAAAALYLAKLNDLKSLFMAPTEILAWQHFDTLKGVLEPLNLGIGLYTGSRKKIQQSDDVIVGTHALLSYKIKPQGVGLLVIDEQHRFGVEQRTLLRSKAAYPHLLTMTATPIPRTVALTLYGDLDLSVIDQLPQNRPVVKTYLVPEHKREAAYKFIKDKIKQGDQVFIITPLIEPSETATSAKAAKVEYQKLKAVFSDLSLALLHGRMKAKDKEQVMSNFKGGQTDILVSTSVVEVGMDIANATVMVIEGAERFGLAQLHQLRGRVGRGVKESFCLLFTESSAAYEHRRLKFLEKVYDGLKLAELDFKIRGQGAIFGTAQHGRFDLKVASLSNLSLIEKARTKAQILLTESVSLDKYPPLKAKLATFLKDVAPD